MSDGATLSPSGSDRRPNDKLKAARLRTQSPLRRGYALSREELGALVAGYVLKHFRETVECDENWVGKLERGVITWPREPLRAALRSILGAPTDEALGLFNRRQRSVLLLDGVDRRELLRVGAAALLSPAAAAIEGLAPAPVPRRVGRTEIDLVIEAARVFASWDQVYGSGPTRVAVQAQLRWSAGLLDATCTSSLRPDLFSAVGFLSHTCGMIEFDAYAHDDAHRLLTLALACADEARDWHLRAKVYSSMARQAVWLGDSDVGLTYTEQALVRSDRLTSTERAMLHTARARALAKLRRSDEALAAVGAADEQFADSNPGLDPPWMKYYDEAQHNGDTAHALWDLSLQGHTTEAETRFLAAVSGHTEGFARSRAISRTKLASLLMATDDPRYAASVGLTAVRDAGRVRSRRLADDLRDLSRIAASHREMDDVAALQQAIATAVRAA